MSDDKCFLCGASTDVEKNFETDVYCVKCAICGVYHISEQVALRMLQPDVLPSESDWRRLSGVTREQHERHHGRNPTIILESNIKDLLSRAPKPFDVPAKVRKLLAAIARKSQHAGDYVAIDPATDYPLAYAVNSDEFMYLEKYAFSSQWLERHPSLSSVGRALTPTGWEELSKSSHIDSTKAFVAMWFNDEVTAAYMDGIAPACEKCGFRAVRIDTEEYNGDIHDQIIAEIKESRFAVCDLTGQRRGVYFEAGYAMGLGIPVIWTCRDDEAKKTHFDAEHFNQIRWTTPEELQRRLVNRIRATVDSGLHSTPIPEDANS